MTNYICPLCNESLEQHNTSYLCINRHCFDIAKEGYVNLLPVQLKHSKQPGDNKAMVNARRAFLSKGYYQPLVERILSLFEQYQLSSTTKVLDAGCGEGYYTHQFKNLKNIVYGVDIAKEAIKKAAKKYTDIHFSVATLSKLPFKNEYFDWIISIYAPVLEQEFTRAMSSEGLLLTVTPGKRHLFELKEYIYKEAQEHDEVKNKIEHLTLIQEQKLTYRMKLQSNEDIFNLLSMTPFAHSVTKEARSKIEKLDQLTCQADFSIRLYKKP